MTPLAAAALPAFDSLGGRFAIDALAVALLAYGIVYRRHRHRDLAALIVAFNVGLFLALTVLATGRIAPALGFGLFAVLAIIRLRSEPFDHAELGSFFIALVLALICGIDVGALGVTALLAAAALGAATLLGRARLLPDEQRIDVVVEVVFADLEDLRRHLEDRLRARVVALDVREIDYVRETTSASVRCVARTVPDRAARPDLVERAA